MASGRILNFTDFREEPEQIYIEVADYYENPSPIFKCQINRQQDQKKLKYLLIPKCVIAGVEKMSSTNKVET